MNADPAELILNRTWRPALSITGFEGAPRIQDAGNVLRPATSVKVSLRLPPTKDADTAGDALKALLEAEPPYGAKVTFELEKPGTGWSTAAGRLVARFRQAEPRRSRSAATRP